MGFIISINVREAASKTETAEGKFQRVPRHQDGIPGSVVSDDSIPLSLHELPQLHAFLSVKGKHHCDRVIVHFRSQINASAVTV